MEKKPDLSKRGYRLDKMEHLLELFNNPQDSYNIIHVAGSKGKGSTCGFLASILDSAGLKTGVYSSPHLLDYRERITNNHNFFPENCYIQVINSIKTTVDTLNEDSLPGGMPTTFELMTLAALIMFKSEKCQWVILETGIGGRLDSTNVVIPKASVITPIELEHTELLGDTIELIAGEKAGIIKSNRPVFTSNTDSKVLEVLKKQARLLHSKLYTCDNYSYNITNKGTYLETNNISYKLGLQGAVQAQNALLAKTVIETILPNIDKIDIEKGLKNTKLPGRFQIKELDNPIILDGAHTVRSITDTVNTFNGLYNQGTIIFGVLKGKDIMEIVKIISKNFSKIIISTPGNFKESDLHEVESYFNILNCKTELIKSPESALNRAKEYNRPILVTGSFYMAGEIAKLI
ncbi:MAG: bifunctional folylpolyglutamate synthase/dihydrofolate synthase [Spirochaetaceae bacterium]